MAKIKKARKRALMPVPTNEEIAKRAFELYVERGGEHSCDVEDWLRAERELVALSA